MNIYKILTLCFLGLLPVEPSYAHSVIGHDVWQDKRSFLPYSQTAKAITGKISLSGNKNFEKEGSQMQVRFSNGEKSILTSFGTSYQTNDDDDEVKLITEVFKLSKDP